MNILVIESSPHRRDSSNMLADDFIRGAGEAGHTVDVIDVAHGSMHPCLGGDVCRRTGSYVQRDTLARYLHLEDLGMVLGTGCGTTDATRESNHREEAYRFGKNLR